MIELKVSLATALLARFAGTGRTSSLTWPVTVSDTGQVAARASGARASEAMADDRSSRHAAADRFFNEHGRAGIHHRPFIQRKLQTSVFRKLMSCAPASPSWSGRSTTIDNWPSGWAICPRRMRMIGSFSP